MGRAEVLSRYPAAAPRISREAREVIADWLILFGALGLLAALFLPWSHQFSHSFLTQPGAAAATRGVPRDPTAWQVYSFLDVLMALLVAALLAVALMGGRRARLVVLIASLFVLAFTVHALGSPPTNGTNLNLPIGNSPASASGEVLALIALGLAISGLALSFTAD